MIRSLFRHINNLPVLWLIRGTYPLSLLLAFICRVIRGFVFLNFVPFFDNDLHGFRTGIFTILKSSFDISSVMPGLLTSATISAAANTSEKSNRLATGAIGSSDSSFVRLARLACLLFLLIAFGNQFLNKFQVGQVFVIPALF